MALETALAPTAAHDTSVDPIAELFVQTESLGANVNAMQLVTVDGRLDAAMLRTAIERIAPRFPLLLTRCDLSRRRTIPAYRAADIPVEERVAPGVVSFDDAEFRQFASGLSIAHPVRWAEGPPVRFWIVRARTGARTALLMTTSHATADAQGDSMLLSALLVEYGAALRGAPAFAEPMHPFEPLESIVPRQAPVRSLSVAQGVAQELLKRADGMRAGGRRAPRVRLDFRREVLTPNLEHALKRASETTGHSLNTVITACLIEALADVVPQGSADLRLLMPVSLRKGAGIAGDRNYQNFMLPCRLTVPRRLPFKDLAAAVASAVAKLRDGAVHLELAKVAALTWLLRIPLLRPIGLWVYRRFQVTSVAYSNPGVIRERFATFGDPSLPIDGYIGVGCVVPPLDFILYTPTIGGRLELNAVYYSERFDDFERELIVPLKRRIAQLDTGDVTHKEVS